MKKAILFLSALLVSAAMWAQLTPDKVVKTETTHDFGKLKQGVPATYTYMVTNISDKPVIIENATPSCGCTTPEWQKEPIAPGAKGTIKVGYNAAGVAPFNKSVTVKLAGVDQPLILNITGEVLAADAYDAWVKANPPAPVVVEKPVVAEKTSKSKKSAKKAS